MCKTGALTLMQTLVIDFDCTFASTFGRVLERAVYQAQVASSAHQYAYGEEPRCSGT